MRCKRSGKNLHLFPSIFRILQKPMRKFTFSRASALQNASLALPLARSKARARPWDPKAPSRHLSRSSLGPPGPLLGSPGIAWELPRSLLGSSWEPPGIQNDSKCNQPTHFGMQNDPIWDQPVCATRFSPFWIQNDPRCDQPIHLGTQNDPKWDQPVCATLKSTLSKAILGSSIQ